MRIDSSFTVPAPPERTFALLLDLERVGPCFPGGEIGQRTGDGAYEATVAVRLGPMRMRYEGTVQIAEANEAAHEAVLQAAAKEARGQGSAEATMTMRVSEHDGGGSTVVVATDLSLTGRAQQVGKGLVQDVAARLVDEMARSLAGLLAEPAPATGPAAAAEANGAATPPPPPSPPAAPASRPISGLRLFLGVVATRLRRLLRRLFGRPA